jgi:hypothetical protein
VSLSVLSTADLNVRRSGLNCSVAARQKLWTARRCTARHRFPQQGSSNFSSNIVPESGSTDFVEDLVTLQTEVAGDDFFLDLGGAAEG